MDPRCSPGWVVSDHPKDQLSNLLRRRSPSDLPPDSDDGFGRDDDEGLLPGRADPPSDSKRWLALLRNHRDAIAATDFFTEPTITFGVLYCYTVLPRFCCTCPRDYAQDDRTVLFLDRCGKRRYRRARVGHEAQADIRSGQRNEGPRSQVPGHLRR